MEEDIQDNDYSHEAMLSSAPTNVAENEMTAELISPPAIQRPLVPQHPRQVAFSRQMPSVAFGMGPEFIVGAETGKTTTLPLILAGAGAIAGAMHSGPMGAGAGLLLTGSAVNAYRYFVNNDNERTAHATFAALEAAVGAYLVYKIYKKSGASK